MGDFLRGVAEELVAIAILGVIQILMTYYVLREAGNLDGDRKDWWEVLEDRVVRWVKKLKL